MRPTRRPMASVYWLCALSSLACAREEATSPNGPAPGVSGPGLGTLMAKEWLVPYAMAAWRASGRNADLRSAHVSEPVFVAQATVVEGALAWSRLGMRWQSDAVRVRWVLSERELQARTVTDVPGESQLIAAFTVTEHLTLRNGLRPDALGQPDGATQPSAQPWYAQPAMRVDFSRNLAEQIALVPDPSAPHLRMFSGAPVSGPDRVALDWDRTQTRSRAWRVDTTARVDASQPRAGHVGFADESLCELTAQRPWECGEVSLRIRWSFAQAQVESRVASERLTPQTLSTLNLGAVTDLPSESAPHVVSSHLALPALWRDPWDRDGRGQRVLARAEGAAPGVDGEGVSESTRSLKTLPFRVRRSQALAVYVLGADELETRVTEVAVAQYNATLRQLTREARRRECLIEHRNTETRSVPPEAIERCDAFLGGVADTDQGPQIALCHSPVWGERTLAQGWHRGVELAATRARGWDGEACGPQGTTGAVGDGIHSLFAFEQESTRMGASALFGATVDAHTHEQIAGQMLVNRAALRMASLRYTDQLRLRSGEIPSREGQIEEDTMDYFPWRLRERSLGLIEPLRGPDVASSLADLRLTALEDLLLSDEQRAIGQQNPRSSGLDALARRVGSPARGFNVAHFDAARHAHAQRLSDQCELTLHPANGLYTAEAAWHGPLTSNRVPQDATFGLLWDFTGPRSPVPVNWSEVTRWVAHAVTYRAVAHGIGHMLGLTHNLAASADVTNYPDAWWAARVTRPLEPRAHLIERGEPAFSPTEAASMDLRSASVMDLDGVAPLRVGRGDRAMLARAHFGLVEAFRSVGDRNIALGLREHLHHDLPYVGIASTGPVGRAIASLHYTQLGRAMGTVPAASAPTRQVPNLRDTNRCWVFSHETRREGYDVFGRDPVVPNVSNAGPNAEEQSVLLVPYRVRRDDQLGESWDAHEFAAASEPRDLAEGLPEVPFPLGAWHLGYTGTMLTLSETHALMRRSWLDPARSLSALSRTLRWLTEHFARGADLSPWLESPLTRANFGAAQRGADRVSALLLSPGYDLPNGHYGLGTRTEDGSVFYQPEGFGGARAEFALSFHGYSPNHSTLQLSQNQTALVRIVGSHHVRALASLYLCDDGGRSDRDGVRTIAPLTDLSPDATVAALGSILSEDWEGFGHQVERLGPRGERFYPVGLAPQPSASAAVRRTLAPALPSALRQWIAVLWIRALRESDSRIERWSAIYNAEDRSAPSGPDVLPYTNALTGQRYVARHVNLDTVPEARRVAPSVLELRRARVQCPEAETDCDAWALRYAERGIGARVLSRARAIAQALGTAVSAAEQQRLTEALRDTHAMIRTLVTLARAR
ncbi:MAG: hypothetical protein Q8Q09_21520 [Deltaproteobacteria bacterium]|nr:hypothetical protein [Deltaproteobacteria bacterium]